MLENLTGRLSAIVQSLRSEARLTESNINDALREVRLSLLEADVALPVIKSFMADVKVRALGQQVIDSLAPGQAFIGIVHQELARLMGDARVALNLATEPPAVFLLAGLQGAGKTTTAAKLARYLRENEKKKVLLASVDVYRPAAIEQLRVLAVQAGVAWFDSAEQQPVAIARAAVAHAQQHWIDVLIVDTAGRLAIDAAMMAEIQQLQEQLQPIETLFVIDAMQGQDAVNTAQAFHEALPLTGIIVTKMDGDARGGAALSTRFVTGKPIKFIGVSEKLAGIEAFHPDRMASRILGMGDVLSLIEQAQQNADQAETKRLLSKTKTGKRFNLNDFQSQLQQMQKMGGISGLMDKLPAQLSTLAQQQPIETRTLDRTQGILHAMTAAERENPELLKASRKRRVALGAGVSVQEVNRLLKQFEQMQKMMKQLGKGGISTIMRTLASPARLFKR